MILAGLSHVSADGVAGSVDQSLLLSWGSSAPHVSHTPPGTQTAQACSSPGSGRSSRANLNTQGP